MNKHETIIAAFYEAFARRDSSAMVSQYADNVQFTDPVFPNLVGQQAKDMWRMLCGKSKDLKVTVSDIVASDNSGSAKWEAWYTFGKTGRKVHNTVHAEFEFQNGKIVRHTDTFSFWKWSSQALGPIGMVLGWSPLLLGKVRKNAKSSLLSFKS